MDIKLTHLVPLRVQININFNDFGQNSKRKKAKRNTFDEAI